MVSKQSLNIRLIFSLKGQPPLLSGSTRAIKRSAMDQAMPP